MTEIAVGSRTIGDGSPAFVFAEIGSNHDGSLEEALKLIDMSTDVGVDAVKLQTFRSAPHYSRHAFGFSYIEGQDTYSPIEYLSLDCKCPGPDRPFSVEPSALGAAMQLTSNAESGLGDSGKSEERSEEREIADKGPRSTYARGDISMGDVLADDMLMVGRLGLRRDSLLLRHATDRRATRSAE